MNLFLLTLADGSPIADKTVAAVTSVTDSTPVDLGNVVLGDSESVVMKFTTGSAAPSFAGDSTYSVSLALGTVTADGSYNYTSTSSFAPITGGWSGRLALDTQDLINAVFAMGGGILGATQQNGNPRGGWLTLQIRVRNPSGYVQTYGLLRLFVEWRVVPANTVDVDSAEFLLDGLHNRWDITSLTGGGTTALDGIVTADDTIPTKYVAFLSYGRVGQHWQLIAGTDAEDPSMGVVRPDDYNASTNARIWVLL